MGELVKFDFEGREYRVSCDLFSKHDHKNIPLYHYDDRFNLNNIVAVVQSDDGFPYPNKYANIVLDDEEWIVIRRYATIIIVKNGYYLNIVVDKNGS